MSQESYNRGFEKTARAHGVDPVALAGFHKQAFSLGELKSKLEGYARKGYGMARDAWHSVPHEYKPLVGAAVGAGGGALGGAALGSLTGLGAGRGALVGAGLGGVGGGLYGANSMAKYLKSDSVKALQGKDKEMDALRGQHKDKLTSQAKTLAETRAKLDEMTHKYTPEELGKMTKEQRKALLDKIRAAQLAKIEALRSRGKANLLPKVYKSK